MEIREFHSDNGGEFMSNEYIKMIESDGARKTTTSPYTPNLNNIAEGCFWRLFSIVRALLHDSGMPKIHWPAAVQQASYILNRTPTSRKREKVTTPYERLIGRKPNLTHLKIWGCLAHGFVPKPTRTGKLDQVAVNGINYGNSRYQRGWNIYIPRPRQDYPMLHRHIRREGRLQGHRKFWPAKASRDHLGFLRR